MYKCGRDWFLEPWASPRLKRSQLDACYIALGKGGGIEYFNVVVAAA